jgi:hypothetical protein
MFRLKGIFNSHRVLCAAITKWVFLKNSAKRVKYIVLTSDR